MPGCWVDNTIRYRGVKSELINCMRSIDKFHNRVLQSLLSQIPSDIKYDIVYRHSPQSQLDLENFTFTCPNVIVVNFDILEKNEFDHTAESITQFSQKFLKLVDQHPGTNFVLMYTSENAQQELSHPRINIVRYGSGMCFEFEKYQILAPQIVKNFKSQKNFMCLNRNPRQHRINLVSYLLALDLDKCGTISFDQRHADAPTWINRVSWRLTDSQEEKIKPLLMHGYNRLKNTNLECSLREVDNIYRTNFSNFKNFDLWLRPMYQDHFVEIVAETQFNLPFFGASEKFKNSVYGCVFPVMIAGHGAVDFLRNLGFDMFDDIVDHSYDVIVDPLDRLCAAIDLNHELLTNNDQVKQLWFQNQSRFLKNIEFIKTELIDIIQQRAYNDFEKVTWKT